MNNERINRLQEAMARAGIGHAFIANGPDMFYLIGYATLPLERITALSIPAEGDAVLFVPRLEAPRVPEGTVEVVPWDELDDPIAMMAERCRGEDTLAIGDHMWSVFLIRLLEKVGSPRLIPASEVTRKLREVKDETEIDALRRAAAGVDRVLARIPREVRFAGRTEKEVAADITRMILEEGHDEAGFAIVASGPNSASPHHEPGDRVIQPGDAVVCDFGGSVDGYFSDVTRTFSVGEPSAKLVEVHSVVHAAGTAARDAVRPGVACQDIDRVARRIIEDAGYGEWFIHRTGHGIGVEVHEHPYIVEGNDAPLARGNAFSVEPGIYLPGELGVRIEDIVVCGEDGPDTLNQATRDLMVVE
nr:MAG: peptidase M24 family protein [Actinomycetota bacterium]